MNLNHFYKIDLLRVINRKVLQQFGSFTGWYPAKTHLSTKGKIGFASKVMHNVLQATYLLVLEFVITARSESNLSYIVLVDFPFLSFFLALSLLGSDSAYILIMIL